MSSQYLSRIDQLEKEIVHHDRNLATLSKQEANSVTKQHRAQSAMSRASSASSLKSKAREYEREANRLADIKKKQADISAKRANAAKKLRDYQKRQTDAIASERKREERDHRRLMRERETQQRRMDEASAETSWLSQVESPSAITTKVETQYDFFVCHASEDKDDIVRDLAELLRDKGARVWYDDFTLTVGSRLRKAIEHGLANSRFGVVIVSEHFFAKEWPQRELDGLFSLDNNASDNPTQSRILPIWHKVSKDEVLHHSPILADLAALNTLVLSTEEIVDKLVGRLSEE